MNNQEDYNSLEEIDSEYLDDEDEEDKEPEVYEEYGNLRLDPETAKRYLEIRKAHERNHEP